MPEDIDKEEELIRFLQMYSSIQVYLKNPFQEAIEAQIANKIVEIAERSIINMAHVTRMDQTRAGHDDHTDSIGHNDHADCAGHTDHTEANNPSSDIYKDEIPIYQKISPGEVLIISKDEDGFLVAENKDGSINIRRVRFSETN